MTVALKKIRLTRSGLTLVELMVTMVITGVVTAAIYRTFRHQQDTSLIHQHIAAVHQNLRGAMNIMISDIQMAGFYTGLDTKERMFFDWDPRNGNALDSFTPSINGIDGDDDDDGDGVPDDGDGIVDMDGYQDRSDVIMVVRAGEERGILDFGMGGRGGEKTFTVIAPDTDPAVIAPDTDPAVIAPDTDPREIHTIDIVKGDLNDKDGGKNYGVLAGADLGRAQLFQVTNITTGEGMLATVTISENLKGDFMGGDIVARADILIYRIDSSQDSFDAPVLIRRNVGSGNSRQVVADNISDLDVTYLLDDGNWVNDPTGEERNVSAVSVTLVSAVYVPVFVKDKDGKKEKLKIERSLTSTVKIRNR